MDIQGILKIQNRIHWEMTPESAADGLVDITVKNREDLDKLWEIRKSRTGFYFFINVKNHIPILYLAQMDEGYLMEEPVNIHIPKRMLSKAVEKQGGSLKTKEIRMRYAVTAEIIRIIKNNLKANSNVKLQNELTTIC